MEGITSTASFFSFATLGHSLVLILYVEVETKAHGEGTGN